MRTQCKLGHVYTPENTSTRSNGTIACRICIRARQNAKNKILYSSPYKDDIRSYLGVYKTSSKNK